MTISMSYDIPDEKIEAVGEMLKYTEELSTTELVESAMELLEWAIEQKKRGREIVAINGNSGSYIPSTLSLLDKVK